MTLKGGLSYRIRGMLRTGFVGVWENLTWVIQRYITISEWEPKTSLWVSLGLGEMCVKEK
jgi:hypothetical protein